MKDQTRAVSRPIGRVAFGVASADSTAQRTGLLRRHEAPGVGTGTSFQRVRSPAHPDALDLDAAPALGQCRRSIGPRLGLAGTQTGTSDWQAAVTTPPVSRHEPVPAPA